MRVVAGLVLLLLTGCGEPGKAPLVSAMSPPGQGRNTEPQPIGSLPAGAATTGPGPNATHPAFGTLTLKL